MNGNIRNSGRHKQRGFSLYELIIALGLAGGMSSAGASLYDVVHHHRVAAEVNQFLTHLSLARSEAIKRGETVTFCPSTDGQRCAEATDFSWWQRGALLFVDSNDNGRVDGAETVLRVHTATERVHIKSSRARERVLYQSNGSAGGHNITFTVCAGQADARYVIVSNSGRARSAVRPPDGRADEPLERCA